MAEEPRRSRTRERRAGSAPRPGSMVGRYVVLHSLGAGAMGVVLSAYDPTLDRKVALKLLQPRRGTRIKAQARLHREAQALAQLNHANVVGVHDVGVHDGRLFVAMELVEGETLERWSRPDERGRPRPWRSVVRVFADAGRGLAAAHERGLVHRDFKPENVMIGRDGRVRVMDFGLARAQVDEVDEDASDTEAAATQRDSGVVSAEILGSLNISSEIAVSLNLGSGSLGDSADDLSSLGSSLTRTGALMGTPAYMAPEQFRGTVNAKTDQFSYCVALYEALYGVRPFSGEDSTDLARAVSEGIIDEASQADVPAWLRRLVVRGLSADPAERFDDMSSLLEALGEGEARRRRRRTTTTLVAAIAVLAVVLGYPRYRAAQRDAECEAVGAVIDGAWTERGKQSLRARFVESEVDHAGEVAERVVARIDDYVESWRTHRKAACMNAAGEGAWDEGRLELAKWCLEHRRVAVSVLVEQLITADADVVRSAVMATTELLPAGECVDESALAGMVEPPPVSVRSQVMDMREALSRVSAMLTAGKYEPATEMARDVRVRAEALGWLPLVARARAAEANLLIQDGATAEEMTMLVDAYMEAVESGTWDVVVDAAINLTNLAGQHMAMPEEGKRWARHAAAGIARAGDPFGLREASRASVLGAVHFVQGEYDDAEIQFERSLAAREEALGSDAVEVALSLNDLGVLYSFQGQLRRSQVLQTRALGIWEEAVGRMHADTAKTAFNLGIVLAELGQLDAARARYQDAVEVWRATVGPEHPFIEFGRSEIAFVLVEMGEHEQARAIYEPVLASTEDAEGTRRMDRAKALAGMGRVHRLLGRAAEALESFERAQQIIEEQSGPQDPGLAMIFDGLGHVHRVRGQLSEARGYYERALALRERTRGADSPQLAFSLVELGLVHADAGRPEAALESLERAVKLREDHGVVGPWQGHGLFALARVLWDAPRSAGRDRPRAHQLARRARAVLSEASWPSSAAELAKVDRWLAEHADPRR